MRDFSLDDVVFDMKLLITLNLELYHTIIISIFIISSRHLATSFNSSMSFQLSGKGVKRIKDENMSVFREGSEKMNLKRMEKW